MKLGPLLLILCNCSQPHPLPDDDGPRQAPQPVADLALRDAAAQTICAVPPTRDRAGVQAALATGCAQLEATEYTIATPQGTAGHRRPYAILSMGAGELRGAPGALLTFVGDAQQQDWWGIEATGGSIHGFAIGTAALTGTSEQ